MNLTITQGWRQAPKSGRIVRFQIQLSFQHFWRVILSIPLLTCQLLQIPFRHLTFAMHHMGIQFRFWILILLAKHGKNQDLQHWVLQCTSSFVDLVHSAMTYRQCLCDPVKVSITKHSPSLRQYARSLSLHGLKCSDRSVEYVVVSVEKT